MSLLLVYDFSTQPFSVGDILAYQEMSLCLCKENGITEIDFVFTYDPRHPVQRTSAFRHINPDNFDQYLPKLLPVAHVNPLVRSVEVRTHTQGLPKSDMVWPLRSKGYLFYEIMEYVLRHFKMFGEIPKLSCKPEPLKKAALGDFVSVQLRRNPYNGRRDSSYFAWRQLFRDRPEIKFIVVCEQHEIDDSMRLPNVTFSKDLGFDVVDDLAVVQSSKVHMGAASGPSMMATFSDKPYFLYNSQRGQDGAAGFKYEGTKGRYVYSKPNQWVRVDKETPDLLNKDLSCCL